MKTILKNKSKILECLIQINAYASKNDIFKILLSIFTNFVPNRLSLYQRKIHLKNYSHKIKLL